jgi:hypothetical protein
MVWELERIPDPTTSGDFTRRFDQDSVLALMEAINATRGRVWKEQPGGFLSQAFIDTDGTIAPTLGECKGGMALSYKGIWGYAPLIISLANTREVLYLVNRPGNVVSHEGCVPWIDRAIEFVRPYAGQITLRGDTDFTLSAQLDRARQPRDQIHLWHGCSTLKSFNWLKPCHKRTGSRLSVWHATKLPLSPDASPADQGGNCTL